MANSAPTVRPLLAETLLAYCTPGAAGEVVATALQAAALAEVPEDPEAFARFARIHLRDALLDRLGSESAEAILERLDHVLGRGVSSTSGTYRRVSLARVNLRKIAR